MNGPPHDGGQPATRLTGGLLAAAQAAWLGLAGVILTLFVVSLWLARQPGHGPGLTPVDRVDRQ